MDKRNENYTHYFFERVCRKLDIYGTTLALEKTFVEFSKLVPDSNNLLFKKNIIKNVKMFNINNFFKKLQIKKIIREISPDIIHTHLGGASKIVDKRWGKFKLITTMHMNYNHEYFKNHDAIICSNNHQKKEIRKLKKIQRSVQVLMSLKLKKKKI